LQGFGAGADGFAQEGHLALKPAKVAVAVAVAVLVVYVVSFCKSW